MSKTHSVEEFYLILGLIIASPNAPTKLKSMARKLVK